MTGNDVTMFSDTLRRCEGMPYGPARSMPGGVHSDPRILALEREQLFMHEWTCVGCRKQEAEPGDFMTTQICDEPVVIVHGEDG